MIVMNGKKVRVRKLPNIWTDEEFHYPEERWMFLWWKIGSDSPIFFRE